MGNIFLESQIASSEVLMCQCCGNMSDFTSNLDPLSLQRYKEKLIAIENIDPYLLEEADFSTCVDDLPDITYPDIVNYLVFHPSPYSAEDMKAYKSLEAYNQVLEGWVREIGVYKISELKVIRGKVLHSQRLNQTPLNPWIIAKENGEILSAHCTCMAGLAEACTHIAAILFWVEMFIKIRNSKTVTDKLAYWVNPSMPDKQINPQMIRNINFRSAKKKRDNFENSLLDVSSTKKDTLKRKTVDPPSENQLDKFFTCLHESKNKAALFRVLPKYAKEFVPQSLSFSKHVLDSLYKEELTLLSPAEIFSLCEKFMSTFSINSEDIIQIKSHTRNQSSDQTWHYIRLGRITASIMRSVCRTSVENPALSLIKRICYPVPFRSIATEWGKENEINAQDEYVLLQSSNHENLSFRNSGFVISELHPYIGASPDGILSCSCCNSWCLEIKCPYSFKDKTINNILSSDNSYIFRNDDGSVKLKENHDYYYQVQTQLLVTGLQKWDFFVWTLKESVLIEIHQNETIQTDIINKAKSFFVKVILPELHTKYYTIPKIALNNEKTFCYCKLGEECDDMIACDGNNCKIEWFHYKCVGIKNPPKNKWYFKECRSAKKISKKSSK